MVEGRVDPRFAMVRDVFEENFAARGEVGAAVAVCIDGKPVVDLWGGWADKHRRQPWKADTLTMVFSSTKGATALCAHVLAARGRLDLDTPVARYWPEFAAAGKEQLPVRMLLNHQAGLPALDQPLRPDALFDWGAMTTALAAQVPHWEPGSAHGYHAMTFGFLVGEVVRRITGQSLGTFFREAVAGPVGLDFWIGLPEELEPRVSTLRLPPPAAEPTRLRTAMFDRASLTSKEIKPDVHFATFLKIFANPKSSTSPITASGVAYTNLVQNFVTKWQAGKVNDLAGGLKSLDKQLDAQVAQAKGGSVP